MTEYDDEKNNLKSLFGDNKYPTGSNFSELINLPDYRLAENNNGTITVNGITYDMTKTDLGSITMVSADFDALPNGLSFVAFGQTNAPESTSAYWVRTLSSSAYGGRKLQVAKTDITNSCYFRTNSNNTWNSWEAIATQTMLNNKVTDNKDGSITVNGSTFVPADDSKVAHLSGANNFDTVPTVNNNPLLLASSLPSDLARTGQDANFTGKLQKSGIDVATKSDVTTAVNTATSSIVTTDKLANFTAGLQSGGVSVATSDDLKSVADSAWRSVNLSDDAKGIGLGSANAFYLKNETTKQFTLIFTGEPSGVNSIFSTPKTLFTDPEISKYTRLSSSDAVFGTLWHDNDDYNNELDLTASISNNSIMFTTYFLGGLQDTNPSDFSDLGWIGYGKITGTYK